MKKKTQHALITVLAVLFYGGLGWAAGIFLFQSHTIAGIVIGVLVSVLVIGSLVALWVNGSESNEVYRTHYRGQ